jgi:hypothetical protein
VALQKRAVCKEFNYIGGDLKKRNRHAGNYKISFNFVVIPDIFISP